MKRITAICGILILVCMIQSPVAFANMRKSNVGAGGTKGFVFTTFSDGFCTISTIYDKGGSQLGVAMGLTTGDLVCAGISSQPNFQSCTAGLPSGTFVFIVTSLRGSSPFRVVVNCTDQENISAAGKSGGGGTEIREIELGPGEYKLLDEFRQLIERTGQAK